MNLRYIPAAFTVKRGSIFRYIRLIMRQDTAGNGIIPNLIGIFLYGSIFWITINKLLRRIPDFSDRLVFDFPVSFLDGNQRIFREHALLFKLTKSLPVLVGHLYGENNIHRNRIL